MGAFAIRGFHRARQEATSVPPILYKRMTTPAAMRIVESNVSNRLIAVMTGLLREHEKQEDRDFLGVNCTLALIRWLPKRADLAEIEALLGNPRTKWQMKQNIFYALFARYRMRIPSRFQKYGLFSNAGKLEQPSAMAKKAYYRLIS